MMKITTAPRLVNDVESEEFYVEFASTPTVRDMHEGLALAGRHGLVPIPPAEVGGMEVGEDGSTRLWLFPVAYAEMARRIDEQFESVA